MISSGDHGRLIPYPVAQINWAARRVRTPQTIARVATDAVHARRYCTGIRAHPWPQSSATRCLSTGCALLFLTTFVPHSRFVACDLQRHAHQEQNFKVAAVHCRSIGLPALHDDRMTAHVGEATHIAASLNMCYCKRSLCSLCAHATVCT